MARREQIFIQALMHKGIVSEETMKHLCRCIFDDNIEDVRTHIMQVNRSIESLGMGIKSAICEITGKKFWLLTSIIMSNLEKFNYESKPFLEFTKSELKFLNYIFDRIINSEEGWISSIDCINSSGAIENFRPSQADQFVKTMIQRMWLSQKEGHICLGVRSIAEFLPFFKAKFKDALENCFLCKFTVFHGYSCEACNMRFHAYCLGKIVKVSSDAKCMNCRNVLNLPNLLSDESYGNIENQMDLTNVSDSNNLRRSSRKSR